MSTGRQMSACLQARRYPNVSRWTYAGKYVVSMFCSLVIALILLISLNSATVFRKASSLAGDSELYSPAANTFRHFSQNFSVRDVPTFRES